MVYIQFKISVLFSNTSLPSNNHFNDNEGKFNQPCNEFDLSSWSANTTESQPALELHKLHSFGVSWGSAAPRIPSSVKISVFVLEDAMLCLPKQLAQAYAAILVPRLWLVFTVGNCLSKQYTKAMLWLVRFENNIFSLVQQKFVWRPHVFKTVMNVRRTDNMLQNS